MKILKKILKISSCLLLMIIIAIIFNTCITKSKQIRDVNIDVNIELYMDKESSNLSKALQFKTISYTNPNEFDYEEEFKVDNTVMVHIRNLRDKIEDDNKHPKYVKTVWGVGYKFGD